jgi:hypothetical protein
MVMRIDEHARAVSYVRRQAKPQFLNHWLRQSGKSCRRHGVGYRRRTATGVNIAR